MTSRRFLSGVLSLADDLEALPLGTQRRVLVEIDGDARLFVIALAEAVRELYALFHRDALYRRERDDVDCADARVAALVRVHVYVLERDLRGFEKGFLNRSRRSDETYDQAVVVFVGAVVEEIHSAFAFEAVHNFVYDVLSAPFAEIRYAFDQLHCHFCDHAFRGFYKISSL